MKKKINMKFMQIAMIAIISTLLLTVAVCYQVFRSQIIRDLKLYADVLQSTFTPGDPLETLSKETISEAEEIRITLVAEDGTVLYDSETDAATMENHNDRKEIIEARQNKTASEIRTSDTLGESMYYYAVLLQNGMVLRVAREAHNVYRIYMMALPGILGILIVLLILSGVMASILSGRITKPIREIVEKEGETPDAGEYEELKPFILALQAQHENVMENAKMRQEFTANVSHELKTPLTAISGYSELIEKGMVSSEADILRFAGEIHGNATRLLTLINDIIKLQEMDTETQEVVQQEMEAVNLWEIAEACVDMLQINAEKHHVTIKSEGERAYILSTRQMMEELLYNLCDNAIRYNKEGGTVTVCVRDRLDTVVLTVKDTGIGIPKEHQERIFERFYRVDKSRSKLTGGTGLGLAIVKHILLCHGVTPVINSKEGVGTEITMVFPAVR